MFFVLAPKIYLFLRGFSSRIRECRGEFFCEERIVIAFVIPGKPLSKKKIQYQHEYHEYNIGGCEYSQILPSQIPVFFCNIFETYQACHGCNQSAETSNIGSDN